jgi:Xaa-Pro dipeptidase
VIPNTREIRERRVLHARARLADVAEHFAGRPLVLSSVAAVAWATGAMSTPIDRVAPSDPLWVVYRDGEMTLVTSSVELARITHDVAPEELGFTLETAPWFEPDAHLRAAVRLAGEDCASDVAGLGLDANVALTRARLGLCGAEIEVMTGLARVAVDAVEGAVGRWRPGDMSDRDIAASVSASLESEGADAVCLIVGGDERLARFRHPIMCGDVPRASLMVVVVARALGLHVALTRLASVREDVWREPMEKCELVNEHVREATVVGATWGDVYEALARGYRAVGQPEAWREHFQGGPIGYGQREFELSPESQESVWWNEAIPAGCATAFNPSLAGGAKIEDTFVVGGESLSCVTRSERWPRLKGGSSGSAVLRVREKKAT